MLYTFPWCSAYLSRKAFFINELRFLALFNPSKRNGYYTYDQVQHSKILISTQNPYLS